MVAGGVGRKPKNQKPICPVPTRQVSRSLCQPVKESRLIDQAHLWRPADAVKSGRVKSDKADAYALAEMLRTGWYRAVYVKSEDSHRLKAMLGARDQLVRAKRALGNQVRGVLRPFGIRLAAGPQNNLGFWERGAQNRGKERHLVDPRRQFGDELFQAIVQ